MLKLIPPLLKLADGQIEITQISALKVPGWAECQQGLLCVHLPLDIWNCRYHCFIKKTPDGVRSAASADGVLGAQKHKAIVR